MIDHIVLLPPPSADEWRRLAHAAQARISAGEALPGDGILSWANCVEDSNFSKALRAGQETL